MREELKPCPFCGDTYIRVRRSRAGWSAGCNTINCVACNGYVRTYTTEQETIEAWNRREK